MLQNSTLAVCKDSNDGSMWLINDTVDNVDVSARELFGFNIGSFSEVTAGAMGVMLNPSLLHCKVC